MYVFMRVRWVYKTALHNGNVSKFHLQAFVQIVYQYHQSCNLVSHNQLLNMSTTRDSYDDRRQPYDGPAGSHDKSEDTGLLTRFVPERLKHGFL